MAFRTHVGRGLDLGTWSNRAILGLSLIAAVAGVVGTVMFDGTPWLAVQAGLVTFLIWALTRELDPDRDSTALIAAALAGVWAVLGLPVDLLAVGGLVIGARLVAETTGRRPLRTDLFAIAVGAIAISFTPLGFVAGFGIAIAIYVDSRMSDEHKRDALIAALVAATGSAVVVSLSGAFATQLPPVQPPFVLALAALTLVAVLREPPRPTSVVDSRRGNLLSGDRIHASRILVGGLTVAGALVAGPEASALAPVAAALALSLASSEAERITRTGR
jgi:hypothetical protein